MDYECAESTMGKPGGADLKLGLATGPALFAWEEHPELGPLIQRKFKQPGDVELVSQLFHGASCLATSTDMVFF
jgi:hexaprenyl-diphosphate synthase